MEGIKDAICQVYAGYKSKQTIDAVLAEFLPGYEELNPDYACKPDDESYVFSSEEEMVRYFIDNSGLNQTFYWNKYHDNPDKLMIGANITDDDKLIICITLDGSSETVMKYFQRLKEFLHAAIGTISYSDPAVYENGEDFIARYANDKQRTDK